MRILALCFAGLAALAQSPDAEIRSVVETFRAAIPAKDKERFLALFHGEKIPWIGVLDEESLERLRRKHPEAAKAKALGADGPVPFIEGIVRSTHHLEETFSNLRIETDGQVASLTFDYTFRVGDYPSNWGKEAWQLVRTEAGWKITSVIYSLHLNPEEPKKP